MASIPENLITTERDSDSFYCRYSGAWKESGVYLSVLSVSMSINGAYNFMTELKRITETEQNEVQNFETSGFFPLYVPRGVDSQDVAVNISYIRDKEKYPYTKSCMVCNSDFQDPKNPHLLFSDEFWCHRCCIEPIIEQLEREWSKHTDKSLKETFDV